MAGPVLADEHNSELNRVFAFQAYVLVGEEVKKKLSLNCIMLLLPLENSIGVNEEGHRIWLVKAASQKPCWGHRVPLQMKQGHEMARQGKKKMAHVMVILCIYLIKLYPQLFDQTLI